MNWYINKFVTINWMGAMEPSSSVEVPESVLFIEPSSEMYMAVYSNILETIEPEHR